MTERTPQHGSLAEHGSAHDAPREAEAARPAPLASELLLRGRKLVEIVHNGEVYRLQATRLGKLILTK
jgi:hemin uptake protein HemP